MPRLRLSLERISIAMAERQNSGQVDVRILQPGSKHTADDRTSKEYPRQSVIARVLARVGE